MPKLIQKIEPSRARRRSHPYYVLERCLEIGRVVKEHGGDRASIPKSVVARQLGIDQKKPAFSLMISSARTFGIIFGSGDFRLTDAGRDYFAPTTIHGKRQAELTFLASPGAFAFLIERFDGSQLPSTENLANLLSRELGISEGWSTRSAQIFLSTAAELKVIDHQGFLRFDAAKHSTGTIGDSEEAQELPPLAVSLGQQATRSIIGAVKHEEPGANRWVYSEGGGTVRLETPDPLPLALWERLKRYVEVLRPSQAEGQENQG